jgi:hypothetical protein
MIKEFYILRLTKSYFPLVTINHYHHFLFLSCKFAFTN